MGFAQPTSSEMLHLSHAEWRKMRSSAGAITPRPEGFVFLEHFWKLAQQR
jgi:hypothetical protein